MSDDLQTTCRIVRLCFWSFFIDIVFISESVIIIFNMYTGQKTVKIQSVSLFDFLLFRLYNGICCEKH